MNVRMVAEFDEMFKRLNHKHSTFMSYEDIYNAFDLNTVREVGNGKTVEAIKKTEEMIILKVFMPKNEIFEVFHHDCKEETKVIVGKVKETVIGVEYRDFEKLVLRKEVPHGLLALENTLLYSALYKP